MERSKFDQIFLDLKTFFTSIDTDNDGDITTDELKTFLTQVGISEQDQRFINQPDSIWKIDGLIDLKLFLHMLIRAFFCCPEIKLIDTQLDHDKSGYITVEELISFTNTFNQFNGIEMTEDQIGEKLVEFDVDQDDKLNPVETLELYGVTTGSSERSILFTQFIPLLSLAYELDADKDGTIAPEEFRQPLFDLGTSKKAYDQIIQTKQYKSIRQFTVNKFMHFCADVWAVTKP